MGGGPSKSEPTGDLLRICCCGGERLVWQRCTCMGICAPTAGRSSTKLLNPVQQTLLTVPWPTVQRRQRWEKDRLATHAVLRHLALRNLSGAFFHGVCRFPPLLPSGARGCRATESKCFCQAQTVALTASSGQSARKSVSIFASSVAVSALCLAQALQRMRASLWQRGHASCCFAI